MEREKTTAVADQGGPALREVRVEGDHRLDSVSACRLIAIDGRALIDLSLRVSFIEERPGGHQVSGAYWA